jgi:hypothetical protein
VKGRDEIADFLTKKWERERDYRLIKEIWAHSDNRIAVRFAYEYRDDSGNWFRAYGTNYIGLFLCCGKVKLLLHLFRYSFAVLHSAFLPPLTRKRKLGV